VTRSARYLSAMRFIQAGAAPHSGHRSGVAQRSYPQVGHRPAALGRLYLRAIRRDTGNTANSGSVTQCGNSTKESNSGCSAAQWKCKGYSRTQGRLSLVRATAGRTDIVPHARDRRGPRGRAGDAPPWAGREYFAFAVQPHSPAQPLSDHPQSGGAVGRAYDVVTPGATPAVVRGPV
jgi:hypothetical protein